MITVNTIELFSRVAELINDNAETTTLSILDDEGEGPTLWITASCADDEFGENDYDPINDIKSPDSSSLITVSDDSPAPFIPSFRQLSIIVNALHNSVEYGLETLESTDLSAESRSNITSLVKETETLVNYLDPFLAQFSSVE